MDELGVEEFERRVDRAHRDPDPATLRALVADLATRARDPAPHGAAPVAEEPVPRRDIVCAVCGGAHRGGPRTAPRASWVLGLMGGVELDLREARFGAGVTDVNVAALMGGVDIVVAPGTRIECRGLALLGGFDHEDDLSVEAPPEGPDPPTLRIRGLACLGGVSVHVRRPGESAGEARRRKKLGRKEEARRIAEGGR